MLRQSLIAAAVSVATITSSASIGSAQTQVPEHHRTVVHHVYTYEPASTAYYGPYYYGYGHIITVQTQWHRSPTPLEQRLAWPSH